MSGSSDSDDDYLINKLAIGINLEDLKSYSTLRPPENGSEYLFSVIEERKKIPEVVSVDISSLPVPVKKEEPDIPLSNSLQDEISLKDEEMEEGDVKPESGVNGHSNEEVKLVEDEPVISRPIVLPPPCTWYLSRVAAAKKDGLWAYLSMNTIVIVRQKTGETDKNIQDLSSVGDSESVFQPTVSESWPEFKLLTMGVQQEKFKYSSLSFCPLDEDSSTTLPVPCTSLVVGDEGGIVRIWDTESCTSLFYHEFHESRPIAAVEWSSLEPTLVYSIDSGAKMIIWDVKRKGIRQLTFPKFQPSVMAVSPTTANLIAIGSKAGNVYIINTEKSGIILEKLRHDDEEIIGLSWAPSGGWSTTPYETTNEILISTSHTSKSPSIRVWDSKGTDLDLFNLWQRDGSAKGKGYKAFIPAGWAQVGEDSSLVTCDKEGEIISWKPGQSSKTLHSLHTSNIIFGVIQCGDILWSFSFEPILIGWNLRKNKLEAAIPTVRGISLICPSPLDPSRILMSGSDSVMRIINMTRGYPLLDSKVPKVSLRQRGKITAVAWHPTKEYRVAFATEEGLVGIYEWRGDYREPFIFERRLGGTVYTLAWGPKINLKKDEPGQNDKGNTNGEKGEVKDKKKDDLVIYACASYSIWAIIPSHRASAPFNVMKAISFENPKHTKTAKESKVAEFAFSPDYTYLTIGYNEGLIELYSFKTLKLRCNIRTHGRAIQYLSWRPFDFIDDESEKEHKWLASASNDGYVKLHDLKELFAAPEDDEEDSEPITLIASTLSFVGHSGVRVISLAWSPHDKNLLGSVSYDRSAIIWDIVENKPIARYMNHLQRLVAVAFHPTDKYKVISCSDEYFYDFTVHIWDYRAHPFKAGNLKPIDTPEMNLECGLRISNADSTRVPFKVPDIGDPVEKLKALQKKEMGVSFQPPPKPLSSSEKKKKKAYALFPMSSNSFLMPKSSYFVHELKYLVEGIPIPELDEFDDNKSELSTISSSCSSGGKPAGDGEEEEEAVEMVVEPKGVALKLALSVFGSQEDCIELVKYEMKHALKNGKWTNAVLLGQIAFEPEIPIREAIKQAQVTEFMINIARTHSQSLMFETAESFVASPCQFNEKDELVKSVGYLLMMEKPERAVQLLMENLKYREAMIVGKCRFLEGSELMSRLENEWAEKLIRDGSIEIATKLFAASGKISEALTAIERRNHNSAWRGALYLAHKFGNEETFLKYALLVVDWAKKKGNNEFEDCFKEYPLLKGIYNSDKTFYSVDEVKRELEGLNLGVSIGNKPNGNGMNGAEP